MTAHDPNRSGAYSHQNPLSDSAARPGGSDSPTGLIPHDRSLAPDQRSSVTSNSRPPTLSRPAQLPSWQNLDESTIGRFPDISTCGSSATAGNAAVQCRS